MAVYADERDAILSGSGSGGGGGGAQYGTAPAGGSGIDAMKRARRDDWIEKSDPEYWKKVWEQRAADPAEAGTIESMLRYNGSPEQWAQNQAETNKRAYANDLDRDADRKRNKRNFLIAAAGIGALSAATAAGAFGGAAAGAGGTAATGTGGATAAGVGKGIGLAGQAAGAGATKGAIAAGAAGQAAGSAGAAGGIGAAGAASGGGLTMATVPTISTGAAAGGGLAAYTPTAVAAGGAAAPAATISAGSGAGLGTYGKWANTALQGYQSYASAKEQEKLAKEAAKGTTTTRTPYMNDALSQLVRYIMAEQARTYANRMRAYGVKAGDYSPFAALLAQIPQSYTGVGR